jgi:hypothetical protein
LFRFQTFTDVDVARAIAGLPAYAARPRNDE